jgi:hypothetical protein
MALPFDPAQVEYIEYMGKTFTAVQVQLKDGKTQILEGDQITPEVRQYLLSLQKPKDASK